MRCHRPRCSTERVAQRPAPRRFRPTELHAFAFAGVLDQRMLGGQALLGFEKLRGLLLGVAKRFERADDFVLVGVGGRIAQRFNPSSARNTVAFFSVPDLVAVITTRLGFSSTAAIRRWSWSY